MNPEQWQRVEQVLDLALDSEPSRWPSIVSEACGPDEALRQDVERLLAEYSRPAEVLGSGVGALAAAVLREREADRHADALTGTRLGAWRVVRQIGRGGMSRVFLGERSDGVFSQRAAIKVLRAGLDTAADRERFRIERQILASLDHPNIARLLDGGVAPDGRPYLVLEYIEGEPLTTYCDARGLDVEARLRLFLSVAEATQSAHRQLVVHRDLKPSNILVGADGRPRLLDFGVAKILDPAHVASPDATATTRRRWLTPEYAAPEQFTGAPVTTATDVYQLGAVLYELLSGHQPFEPVVGSGSLEQRILGDDPPAPSSHRAALGGDLDAIVLKALRKEPGRRYPSVAELAADVQRYVNREPVSARAGDRAYRWRRLARRRALPIALGAAAIAMVGVYVGTLSVQNRRIDRALAMALVEREKSNQVTGFLLGLFRANDPQSGRGDSVSARTLLARGEARASALQGQPEVQAEMLEIIGRVRGDLGAFDDARPSLERALAIRRRILSDSHPDLAKSLASLATLDRLAGRLPEAERGYREALKRQRASLGDTAAATQLTLFELGNVLHTAGRYKDAKPIFEEWERLVVGQPHRRDEVYAEQLQSLGLYVALSAKGDSATLDRAERHLRESLAIRREGLGPRHAQVALSLQYIANMLSNRGRLAEAETMFREAVAIFRSLYPAGHPDLAATLVIYGLHLKSQDRHEEALVVLREGVAMERRYLGEAHEELTTSLSAYGDALRRLGNYAAAEPILRDVVDRQRRRFGDKSIMTAHARIRLGDVLRGLGRAQEAESLLLTTYANMSRERGVGHAQSQFALRQLVKLYEGAGRLADAAKYRSLITSPERDRTASSAH
jgi:eukaryotic-like serine/threonine-protein kinase